MRSRWKYEVNGLRLFGFSRLRQRYPKTDDTNQRFSLIQKLYEGKICPKNKLPPGINPKTLEYKVMMIANTPLRSPSLLVVILYGLFCDIFILECGKKIHIVLFHRPLLLFWRRNTF